jgi:hypothetical protein
MKNPIELSLENTPKRAEKGGSVLEVRIVNGEYVVKVQFKDQIVESHFPELIPLVPKNWKSGIDTPSCITGETMIEILGCAGEYNYSDFNAYDVAKERGLYKLAKANRKGEDREDKAA